MKNLSFFEKKLGLKFRNKNLLKQSLIHRSYLNEHPNFPLANNERLEFLGDAVLELITTKFLYKNFNKPEGELTSFRASLVKTKSLAEVATELKINDYLHLSKGEAKSKGKAREVILANTFEALVGAIYLDQGFVQAEKFIHQYLLPKLDVVLKYQLYKDPKSKFQEINQNKFKITPTYRVIKESGPDHAKKFIIGVFLKEKLIATGKGGSKQEAQTNAAQKALEKKSTG